MNIEELIGRLYAMMDYCGNVKVEVRNSVGDWDETASLSASPHERPDKTELVVFIDT